jgi:hypothetical protein
MFLTYLFGARPEYFRKNINKAKGPAGSVSPVKIGESIPVAARQVRRVIPFFKSPM